MSAEVELQPYWDDLRQTSERPIVRPHRLSMNWTPPQATAIQGWATALAEGSDCLLAVKGEVPAYRSAVFQWCGANADKPDAWLHQGVFDYFARQVATLDSPSGSWAVLWSLLEVEEFVVQDPLLDLVDQGFRFTELFKALWEARFLLSEGRDPRQLVYGITRWLLGEPLDAPAKAVLAKANITRELDSTRERLDMMLFLLALARQNGAFDQGAIALDGLEKALRKAPAARRKHLRDVLELVTATERWCRLGSGLGLVVGFDPRHGTLDSLKRYSSKLDAKIRAGLVNGVHIQG